MVTRRLFIAFLGILALQRMLELRRSRKNEQQLHRAGGIEFGKRHYPWMVAIHTGWFLSMIVEVMRFQRPFHPILASLSLLGFWVGQALRLSAMKTLGPRWTVRVIVLPDTQPVTRGLYRTIRHPNYLGVFLEILTVPLIHTAYITSLIFSLIKVLWLIKRIQSEEDALAEWNRYTEIFQQTPRFIPTLRREGTAVQV